LQDDADGGLDCAAVFREGEVEAGLFAEALAWGWFAGGVVVVAEGLSAEADAAAAVAVGEDVAALVTFGLGLDCFVHFGLSPHLGVFVQSIQKSGDKSGLLVYLARLNAKARLFEPGLVLISYSSILSN
jgi:hypothetical protein